MKSKKILLVLAFAAVLAVGWVVVVRAVTSTEALEEQNALVREADGYMERELYVRAISLYEKALSYSTDQELSIQEKLAGAYLAYGNLSAYIKLLEKRIAEGNAGEEEYISVAEYYRAKSKLTEALTLIRKGMEQTGSERLGAYFEEHRYSYKIRTTKYEVILPTESNSLMPAFDGEKWGYVDGKGKKQIDFCYDSALPFNRYGYAVVSMEGTYYTILRNGDRYGADDGRNYSKMTDVTAVSNSHILGERDGSYSYFDYDFRPVAPGHQYSAMTSNACGVAAVQKGDRWGIITDGGSTVVDFVLEEVAVNSLGCAFAGDRAMVKENGRWHLIDTEGNPVGEGGYAQAKAPESEEYIAVADSTGRWGYIDRQGELVIEYQYQDALSFSNGLGAVQLVNDWGYISAKNVMVIDAMFGNVKPFHNGTAQVELAGGTSLLTLDYFENL